MTRSPRSRSDRGNAALRKTLDAHVADLGYALAAEALPPRRRERDAGADTTPRQPRPIPDVPVLFWSFRFMVGLGFWFIAAVCRRLSGCRRKRKLDRYRAVLARGILSLPLPWIAAELGWIVAEYGRQPWVIEGVLPTALGVSSTVPGNVLFSLLGFALFYSALLVADLYLLVKYIRLGPDEHARPHRAMRTPRSGGVKRWTMKRCASSGGRCSAFC